MKQKTAVEFVVEKLEKFIEPGNQIAISIILEEGKQMEKEQRVESYDNGYANGQLDIISQ
jgi:hypothetical protein